MACRLSNEQNAGDLRLGNLEKHQHVNDGCLEHDRNLTRITAQQEEEEKGLSHSRSRYGPEGNMASMNLSSLRRSPCMAELGLEV